MIGIYCWTNKITGEQYVGQSINIEGRQKQHIYTMETEKTPLHLSMKKYGLDNFDFKVLEECKIEELDEKERFWISKLNTYLKGYNMTTGGQEHTSIGEENPNTFMTNEDVLIIRKRVHINGEYPKDVYEDYKNLISYDSFWQLVHGDTWQNVDCSMIKPIPVNNHGQNNPKAKLKDEDVIEIRNRKYLNGERTIDIYQDYKERISFSAFEKVALGTTWKHIPIPKKS